MKKLLSIFLSSSLVLLVLGFNSCENIKFHTASVHGLVTDQATGEPIKTAGVELVPTGLKTITGSDGRFEFTNLEAGNYSLRITKMGYEEYTSSQMELAEDNSLQRDIQITPILPSLKVVDNSRNDLLLLDFGSSDSNNSKSFNLFNDGEESISWSVNYTAPWITSLNKETGELKPGATQPLIVYIDRSKLTGMMNYSMLIITSNSGSKELPCVVYK